MRRLSLVARVGAVLLLAACEKTPSGSSPSASGSAAAGGDADVAPPIEVTAPRPAYALSALTDKQLEKLVAKAGWTPTIVGKSPPADGASTVRVAAIQKSNGQQLEAIVLVRCRKQGDKKPAFQPGEAYFSDGDCHMNVAVRLGIRNKSAQSQALLEKLLGTHAD